MQTVFPTATGFSGTFLIGERNHPVTQTRQHVGSFILRRGYTLAGNELTPNANDEGILFADQCSGIVLDEDNEFSGFYNHQPQTPEEQAETDAILASSNTYIQTTHENNLAIYKPLADLIVLDFFSAGDSGEATVTNGGAAQQWFSRPSDFPTGGAPPDMDARDNLFGWEQRAFAARSAAGDPPSADRPLANNSFFNAYRRDFSQPGFPLTQFNPNAEITVTRRRPDTSEEEISFSLNQENVAAKLLVYRGRGPDKRSHWCCEHINNIKLDTVVVQPESNQVYVLWRGLWDINTTPLDQYRLLQITAEEIH